MIDKTELLLAYQRETGLGFQTILDMRDHKMSLDMQEYVEWLENLILIAANAGKIEL